MSEPFLDQLLKATALNDAETIKNLMNGVDSQILNQPYPDFINYGGGIIPPTTLLNFATLLGLTCSTDALIECGALPQDSDYTYNPYNDTYEQLSANLPSP